MSSRTVTVIGGILTGLTPFVFLFTGALQVSGNEAVQGQATAHGLDLVSFQWLDMIEIVPVLPFVVPYTGMLGTLLLITYMGEAIATHLGNHHPITMVVAIQMLVWITAALRFPELR